MPGGKSFSFAASWIVHCETRQKANHCFGAFGASPGGDVWGYMTNNSNRLRRRSALFLACSVIALAAISGSAWAAPVLPTGGVVTAGSATISSAASVLTVNQTSAKGVITWQTFSIGQGDTVQIDNGTGVTLNRVTGGSVSSINGLLSATGSVYLINPNGVIIGKNGVVNTGGSFVASTLDVSNSSFLAGGGALSFTGASTASVVNLGKVGALGGNIALIATTVSNSGALTASNGTVGLAAGSIVTLDDSANDDGGLLSVQLGGPTTSVTTSGLIQAAAVELRAQQGNIFALAGNAGDGIDATGVDAKGGRIWLVSQDGTASVAGTLDARGANGAAGQVETSAQTLDIGQAGVNTHGGTWLLDPSDITITGANVGTLETALASGNVIEDTSTGTGGSGNITVNAPITWSSRFGLTLNAVGALAINAPITIAGAGQLTLNFNTAASATDGLSFGLTAAGFTGSAGFAAGAGEGIAGQALTVNGQAYNLVYSLADLAGIGSSYDPAGNTTYYALAKPLTSTTTYTDAVVSSFSGTLEGLGQTITGLTMTSNDDMVGLIGTLNSGGRVRDLGLVNVNISGTDWVGGLVGYSNGTVETSYATGAVSGDDVIGGLVGGNYGGIIETSYAPAAVSGAGFYAGGLTAYNGGTIATSYATGAVSAASDAGGLVGWNANTISTSYATGTASAGQHVGGLVALNGGAVSTSYATGAASGLSNVGGLVGDSQGGTVSTSYWDTQTTGQNASAGGGTGLTTAQLQGNSGGYMSSLGAAFGGGTGGLYPYLAAFFPNGAQAVTGTLTVASASQLGVYAGGVLLDQGTTSVGADGYYYLAVPVGTFSTTGPNKVAVTVALPTTAGDGTSVAPVSAFSYTDTATLSGGLMTGPALTTGIAEITGDATYSALQADLAVPFGASTLAALQAQLATTQVDVVSTNASGFTVDRALNPTANLFIQTMASGAPITVSAPVTVSGSNVFGLVADGSVNIDAPISVTGGGQVILDYGTDPNTVTPGSLPGSLSFDLTAAGFNGPVTYATGTGEGIAGQALTINSQAYNLVYSMADLAGIGTSSYEPAGNTTYYALAAPLTSTVTYAGAVVIDFRGTLEGLGHTITGLTINSSGGQLGLIGTLEGGGVVRDVGLIGDRVSSDGSGSAYIGGLVGWNFSGTVSTSYATGTVAGGQIVGGLVGYNSGAVSTSYATGTVSGLGDIGGLVGLNDFGTVSTSYATGAVLGGGGAGGLVGTNDRGTVETSYATGAVSGSQDVGGLVGYNNNGTVLTSYATGAVSGPSDIGGLVGSNVSGTVSTSYWDTQTSGQSTSSGGGTGLTTAQLQSNSGGDMSSLGAAFSGGTGGFYPYLTAFFPNGIQAVTGTLSGAAAAQVGLYSGGVLLGQGTTSVGADGYYYLAVPAGTFSATSPNKVGDSLGSGTALNYTDSATLSGGFLALPAFTAATMSETTADSSYSALQADLATTFGAGALATLQTALTNASVAVTSTNATGFTVDQAVSTEGRFSLSAAGALTLAASGSVSAGANDDITLRTPGAFINQAGSRALSVLGLGQWLVYSSSPGADTFDDLDSDNTAVWSTSANASITVSGDHYVFAYTPALTLASGNASKTYGQDDSAALQSDFTITGLEPGVSGAYLGDTAAAVYSGTPVVSSIGSAQTASVAGGPYAIVANTGSLFAQDGYILLPGPGGALTVNPASLTITANNASMTYGASSLPGLGVTYHGLVAGDTSASLTTDPTLSTTATAYNGTAGSSSNAGTYAITASGAVDSNYSIHYASGSLTVNPADLTIAAGNASMTYGGSSLPALTAGYSGLANGDTSASLTTDPTLSTAATAYNGTAGSGSNAGTYAVTASGAVDSNYSIHYTAGALTVNPADLTIAAGNASTTYGGSSLPTFSASYTGMANGDTSASLTTDPTLSTTATAYNGTAGSGANAGTYAITASGAVDNNYSIHYTSGSLTVNPADLTIAAGNASMTYGGSSLPALTAGYSGLANGDTSASLTTDPTLSTTATAYNGTAGSGANAGTYAITASGAVDNNYSIHYVAGALTVNPASVTITALGGTSTSGASAANPGLSAAGLQNGDTLAALDGLSNSFGITAGTPAGVYGLTVLGLLTNPDYTVASTSSGVWTVSAPTATGGPTPISTTVAGVVPEMSGFTTLTGWVPGVTSQIEFLRLASLAQAPEPIAPVCAASSLGCPDIPYPTNLQVGPGIRFVASK